MALPTRPLKLRLTLPTRNWLPCGILRSILAIEWKLRRGSHRSTRPTMFYLTLQEETTTITWPTINSLLKMLIKLSKAFIVKTVLNNHRRESFSRRTTLTEREVTMRSLESQETQALTRSRGPIEILPGSTTQRMIPPRMPNLSSCR